MASKMIENGIAQRATAINVVAIPPKILTHKMTKVGAQQANPDKKAGNIAAIFPNCDLRLHTLGILILMINKATLKNANSTKIKPMNTLKIAKSMVTPKPVFNLIVGSHKNGALSLNKTLVKSGTRRIPNEFDSKRR